MAAESNTTMKELERKLDNFHRDYPNDHFDEISKKSVTIILDEEIEVILKDKVDSLYENDLLDINEIETFRKGFITCYRFLKDRIK